MVLSPGIRREFWSLLQLNQDPIGLSTETLHLNMSLLSNATFNLTLYNDPSLCTIKTCPIDWATIQYVPSLAGNAFYLAFFIIILVFQIYLGARYRTWSFMVALLGGEILEVIGYAGRIELHDNIFVFGSFLM